MPEPQAPATKPWTTVNLDTHPFLKKHALIIYAVILVVLIPLVIIGNTLYVIKTYRHTIDVQLHTQAAIVGELLASHFGNRESLASAQVVIEDIHRRIDEINTIDILVPEGENFRIIASTVPENKDQLSEHPANKLSWIQNSGVANQSRPSDEDLFRDPDLADDTFWNVAMPIHDGAGEKIALVNLKLSLRELNKLEKSTLVRSSLLLIITLLIIMALMSLNTKFFEFGRLYRKLQEVDQMKDEFISMASHELRAPITAIKGYVSMFTDGSFGVINDAGKKSLSIVSASVRHLDDLVEDLLNVSRIEQNRLQLNPEVLNLNESIQQAIDELKVLADNKSLQLIFTKDISIPAVVADRDHLRQILVNLISNAIKYTPTGTVTVTLSALDDAVKVKVKDTGIGIGAQAREKLFTKFYRVTSQETKGIRGTGLGLWITKQLVNLMGGEIYVDSIEGVGTEFSFTLPVAKDSK